ncbi:MAG TPA: nucleotide exchange factor GrpE [Bacteroidaceae bacterium]|nr:nucleotide exchange factor GrpE [Bacteroidaceae bacterium]
MNRKEETSQEAQEATTQAQASSTKDSQEKMEETQEETTELSLEEQLTKQVKSLEEQLSAQKDKYLRLSAEYDNYRKRSLKEKTDLILNGGEKAFTSILPILDDMERALETMAKVEDVAAVKEGVDLIYNKFVQTLSQQGVKSIDTNEMPLDTDLHEAIAMIPAPSEELKGKILDCVQQGYRLNEKVIRHAKVVVGE